MRNDTEPIYEEHDITEEVASVGLQNKLKDCMLKNINWHHYRTLAFWACVFIVGGLQALKGSGVGDFTTAIAIIGFFEHSLLGKTE